MGLYRSKFPNVTTWTTGFIKTIILFSEQLQNLSLPHTPLDSVFVVLLLSFDDNNHRDE